MVHETVSILSNREISRDYFELTFTHPARDMVRPEPGQFLTVRISEGPAPLLRRPFAFADYTPATGSIIYQRRGPGTDVLAGKRENDDLDIIAPLGNHWPAPRPVEHPVLIAGGIGMGPILFFARRLLDSGRDFTLIIGARTADYLPDNQLLEGLNPILATDDGSLGVKGTVCDALPQDFGAVPVFYACGPHKMMHAVHLAAEERDVRCLVSMEQTMACGVGACMGCVIRLTGDERYARVCTDGPIFDSRDIVWT